MRILNSHFHWWPRSMFEELCGRTSYPNAYRNKIGGYEIMIREGIQRTGGWKEWFDLDELLAHQNRQGYPTDVICSAGPLSSTFSEVPSDLGLALCQIYNDEMAGAQRKHEGHLWASAVLPFSDTKKALDELERAVGKLGLMGVNVPGSIGPTGHIDAPALEPLYTRIEQLGLPLFLHPTDAAFQELMDGYNSGMFNTIGRTIDITVSAGRMFMTGLMERHPNLKVFVSHTAGALPFQAGKMDKSSRAAKLPKPPTTYMKRFYTDTVNPEPAALRFTIDYFGVDQVMYGDDYPCWTPEEALKVLAEVGLSEIDREKIMNSNARRFFNVKQPAQAAAAAE